MSAFFASLPEDTKDPRYAEAILGRVRDDGYDSLVWSKVTSTIPGHAGEFAILSDTMKIDGVRFTVDAATNQAIADMMGSMLITPKLSDLAYFQRAVTLMFPIVADGHIVNPVRSQPVLILSQTASDVLNMSKRDRMLLHSKLIDEAIAATDYKNGIVRDVGKFWCLSNLLTPSRAMNYGAYAGKTGGIENCVIQSNGPCRVFQGPGTRHDPKHIDYSQICTFVSRQCLVDGALRDLADIVKDPILAPLVSHEGALRLDRQPGVPISACSPGVWCGVQPPTSMIKGAGGDAALILGGAAVGAAIGGPIGAAIGATAGGAIDVLRRIFT